MKYNVKKAISLIIATSMCTSVTVNAMAANNVHKNSISAVNTLTSGVAQVGDVTYDTLQDAVNAVPEGGTVKLLGNVQTGEKLNINKPMTIDLGGFELSLSTSIEIANVASGAVTIKNGSIKNEGYSNSINVNSSNKFEINEVKMNCVANAINCNGINEIIVNNCNIGVKSGTAINISNNNTGNLYVKGSTITKTSYGTSPINMYYIDKATFEDSTIKYTYNNDASDIFLYGSINADTNTSKSTLELINTNIIRQSETASSGGIEFKNTRTIIKGGDIDTTKSAIKMGTNSTLVVDDTDIKGNTMFYTFHENMDNITVTNSYIETNGFYNGVLSPEQSEKVNDELGGIPSAGNPVNQRLSQINMAFNGETTFDCGENVVFNVAFTKTDESQPNPEGKVQFYIGSEADENKIGEAAINNGVATLTVNDQRLTAGKHNIIAVYDGNGVFDKATATTEITINSLDVKDAVITLSGAENLVYDGTEKTPTVTVTSDTMTITPDNYDVSYKNNKNAGTATVVVTFKGQYSGEITKDFSINKAPLTVTGATISQKYYDGTNKGTVDTITFDGVVNNDQLTINTDFSAEAVFDNQNVGTGKNVDVTVSLKDTDLAGNYYITNNKIQLTNQTIEKGTYPSANVLSPEILVQKNNGSEVSGEITVNSFFVNVPEGAVISKISPAGATMVKSVKVENGKILYTVNSNITSDITEAYTVTISSPNYNDITTKISFKTTDKKIANVTISGQPESVSYGNQPFTLTAVAKGSDGNNLTGGTWIWSSSDTNILTVDQTGKVTVLKPSDKPVTIKAEYSDGEYTGFAEYSVVVKKAVPPLSFEYGSMTKEPGSAAFTNKLVYPDYINSSSITYTSSNTAVADVNSTTGEITVKEKGTTVITANLPGTDNYEAVTAKFTLTVGSSSSGSTSKRYSVFLDEGKGGDVKLNHTDASRGSTIIIDVTPDKGYELDYIRATDSSGNEVKVEVYNGDRYSFIMPDSNVQLKVRFMKEEIEDEEDDNNDDDNEEVEENEMKFADVSKDNWFYDAVKFVYDEGIMNGTSEYTFSPYQTVTREMLAVIVYNMEGQPDYKGTIKFTDVNENAWYYDGVSWAAENGIVAGYGNGIFGTGDMLTREQLVSILYRYTDMKGIDTPTDGTAINGFYDKNEISDYAVNSMKWAIGQGIISGDGTGHLNPKKGATRAEIASILMRYYDNVLE